MMTRLLVLGVAAAFLRGPAAPQEPPPAFEHWTQRAGFHAALFSSKKPGTLRVMTGGALAKSGTRSAACLSEILEASGIDAVAIGYEDLQADAPDFGKLLGSEKLPFVCANVKDVGRSHVVRNLGSTRIALVGVTKPPSYRKTEPLPGGRTIENPAAVLKELLPKVSREADLIVLLAVMDRIECAQLVKEVPGIALALVPAVTGNDPEPLEVNGTRIIQSPQGPEAVGRLSFASEGKKLAQSAHRIETIALSEKEAKQAQALLAKHAESLDLKRLFPDSGPRRSREAAPLQSLEPGKTQALGMSRSDRSVEIEIQSVRSAADYGGQKAPGNNVWLVLESEWRNIIPLTFVAQRKVPTTYMVADATNNLYVVVNGKTLCRLEGELSSGPGGLLDRKAITLPNLRSTRKGNLIFPISSSGVTRLDLYYYDFMHGHIAFPLLAPADASAREEKPITALARNEILEAGIFRMTEGKLADGKGRVVLVDLRARSLATVEGDATAFDSKAKAGEKARLGIAGDVEDAFKGLRLIVEGGQECAPMESTSLPRVPRFLPEVMTGWEIAFVVPEKSVLAKLQWTFSEIGMPDGRTVKPAPLTIPIAGRTNARLCTKCGEEAGTADKFCAKCGTKLGP